jgi:UDP-2-acetamido-2,6-beta-L-arabino-hexul-4-ose reductase
LIKDILITGSDGFLGKNLCLAIEREYDDVNVIRYNRNNKSADLEIGIKKADIIFHLAGVNRPENRADFASVNTELTEDICNILKSNNKTVPIIFSSTSQVSENNDYGKSKLKAEAVLLSHSKENKSKVYIFRLNNVFGKWCKPNYNSVVATFCHNISKGLDIKIDDPKSPLKLNYIDDVIDEFLQLITIQPDLSNPIQIEKCYVTSVGRLAEDIKKIRSDRENHIVGDVGIGFDRALYATYLSYIKPDKFVSDLKSNHDERGNFVEMVKTKKSGQISFFSARPGVTRGAHFHHTKNEKFLVLTGKAIFKFKNMLNNEYHEVVINSTKPQIVETIPGWAHDITNIGDTDMLVMLWANEVFDEKKPDTFWEDPRE